MFPFFLLGSKPYEAVFYLMHAPYDLNFPHGWKFEGPAPLTRLSDLRRHPPPFSPPSPFCCFLYLSSSFTRPPLLRLDAGVPLGSHVIHRFVVSFLQIYGVESYEFGPPSLLGPYFLILPPPPSISHASLCKM